VISAAKPAAVPPSPTLTPNQTALGGPANSQLADAPSIGLESTHVDRGKETSDDDDEPGWNMPNKSDVAAQEAARIHANLANSTMNQVGICLTKAM
jgi:hypothetical protein